MNLHETIEVEATSHSPVAVAPWHIRTPDDVTLVATHYEPVDAVATLLILPGIGTPQRFYRHFAQWMASHGVRVITMDYRGVGASPLPPGGGRATTLAVWGGVDGPAVFRAVEARFGAPTVLGHSFGGQSLGLNDDMQRARAVITVASPTADWRSFRGWGRGFVASCHYARFPLAASIWDVVPGWAAVGAAVPSGVLRQWAAWGRTAGWLPAARPEARARFLGYEQPLQAFWFTDDLFAPEAAVEALLQNFACADIERVGVSPGDLGVASIGHLGFFRPGIGQRLWPIALATIKRNQPSGSGLRVVGS